MASANTSRPQAELLAHRLEEEAEGRARAEGADRDQAAAHQDDDGRAPARGWLLVEPAVPVVIRALPLMAPAAAYYAAAGCGPQHGLLLDRQIDHRGQYAEHNREPPHNVVGAGALVQQAAHPGAEEAADLVAEEGKAVERREPARAEHQRDEARGRRHGGEPHQAHAGGEQQRRDRARRQQHERRDEHGAQEIVDREQIAARIERREPADRDRADDVEQADGGERPAADLRAEAAVDQIGRQMQRDEGELEAAGEEAEHEQHVGAMAERLGERAHERLRLRCGRSRLARRVRRRRERERHRNDQQQQPAEHQQGAAASRRRRSARRRTARTGTGRTSPPPCRRRSRSCGSARRAACRTPRSPD